MRLDTDQLIIIIGGVVILSLFALIYFISAKDINDKQHRYELCIQSGNSWYPADGGLCIKERQ